MRGPRILVVLLFASATIGIATPIAQADSFDDLQNSTDHGYENGSMRVAFSLDTDPGGNISTSTAPLSAIGQETDITYTSPPDDYHRWNENEISNFSVGERDTSRYPEGADTVDGRWIRDAHITKFWHKPSTTVHLSKGQTVQYASNEGVVYGAVDYRVPGPPDDNDGSDGVKKERSYSGDKIESVCLVYGLETSQIKSKDDPCSDNQFVLNEETDDLSHPSIEFKDEGTGNRTYHLVAKVTTEVEVVTKVEEEYEDCTTTRHSNGSIDTDCVPKTRWVVDDTTTVQDEVIVADAWDVRLYDNTSFTVATTDRDNSTVIHARSQGQPWAGLTVDGVQYTTNWRFYTRRDTGWDSVTEASNTGSTTSTEYQTVPVKTYAFPSSRGMTRLSDPGVDKVYHKETKYGENRSSPIGSLHENVNFTIAANNTTAATPSYQQVRTIQVASEKGENSSIEMAGIVHGESRDSSTFGTALSAESVETDLSASVVEANETHVALNITLTTVDGNPIDLQSRRGAGKIILPTGQEIRTDGDGTVKVVFNGSNAGLVRFEPGTWYGRDTAYESSMDRYADVSTFTTVDGFLALILSFVSIFGPVLGALYLMDGLVGIDTWPPVRK